MSLLYPLASILGEMCGKISDKFNFKYNCAQPQQQMLIVFLVMAAGALAIALYSGQPTPAINISTALVAVCIVSLSFLQNYFEFRGLAAKDLSYREPFADMQPVLAGFLAYLLFPSERELKYVAGILVGAAILYLGNRDKAARFRLDRGTGFILLAILFDSLVVNSYKFGLQVLSPEWLFLFRTAGVLVLAIVFGGASFGKLRKGVAFTGFAAGMFYLVGSFAYLYSIQYLGLNLTIMLLMAHPALIYLASAFVLKEDIPIRRIVTSFLLVLLILFILFI